MTSSEVAAGAYVHFPYCRSRCAYCAFVSTDRLATRGEYVRRLLAEIEERADGRKTDTFYFGGGTPSVMPRGTISAVAAALRRGLNAEIKEFTVEANPESASEDFFSECEDAGVTRISMGLQSASDEVLRRARRAHDLAGFIAAARRVRGRFDLSSDLIVGLPGETEGDIARAIELFDELNVCHASVYMLSVEEGTPLHRSGYRADDDMLADRMERAAELLARRGLTRYEVSNFARPGKEAMHNSKYWTGADYFGFGAAAHSLLCGVRRENTSDLAAYLAGKTLADEYALTADDRREELVMLRLRTREGLSLAEYARVTGGDLATEKRAEIERLVHAGLVIADGGTLRATDRGFMMLNSVITELI